MAATSPLITSNHSPNYEAPTTLPIAGQEIQTNSEHEAFPSLTETPSPKVARRPSVENIPAGRSRESSNTSSLQGRLRSASKNFQESSPPTGMWIATGQIASQMPTISDVRRGTFGSDGWSGEGQVVERERRASVMRRGSAQGAEDLPRPRSSNSPENPKDVQFGNAFQHQSLPETDESVQPESGGPTSELTESHAKETKVTKLGFSSSADRSSNDNSISPSKSAPNSDVRYRTDPFDNGYQFPPKHSWGEATRIFLVAFWKFFITPIGFLVTIYGLNVVAWGGMLFLLLCNASPAMCKPTCNDINSPRRIWIETDSQILNALFCVTGFGTIPWRFRDLYYLLQYRIQKKEIGIRRLAGINRGWFRLAGSQDLPVSIGPS